MKHSELRHQPRHVNPRIQGVMQVLLILVFRLHLMTELYLEA